ncbi:helix-turn-helix domain-containing protein [Oscillibacter ruminantium]|uniref:helix-turn-helix domain-containing protein n=1 Tax=Oscillibacter ruminantium TaxID=1263547 RepID=UPI0002D2D2E0|nr:helix-turn-helix domain-containing protein [Oscillibacter ruminantium]
MKESSFRSFDELPLFLNAKMVAEVLGISTTMTYELMNQPDFPALRIRSRVVVPKDKLKQWVEEHTGNSI